MMMMMMITIIMIIATITVIIVNIIIISIIIIIITIISIIITIVIIMAWPDHHIIGLGLGFRVLVCGPVALWFYMLT